jgi:adenylate cyclase
MTALPSGTVSFLFTDIEGSTRLWEAHDGAMRAALARHDALMRRAVESAGGHVFKTVGDAFCAAFATAPDAIMAALAAQQALQAEAWPAPLRLRVRMAVHTGHAELREGDYFGAPLNRVARLLAAGHGGQTLVSEATCDLAHDHLPPQAAMKPLGDHLLKDLTRRERIFQLCHPDLPVDFPPLKTLLRPTDAQAPSIAVLPFVNLSADHENEYFADGLAEELLNVLAKVRGLRVASRTSAFFFKGKDVDLATVAQKLNVATVLEGSVRKSGNRVRITAQLIEVATDSHLWSETYDRELTDIFVVQDDIAGAVVTELRAALLGEAPTAAASARAATEVATLGRDRGENAEAYRLYLQARFYLERRRSEDVPRALTLLQQAVAIEPDYALGWVGLARAYRHQGEYTGSPVAESYARARAAAQRALELAPDLAEAHLELGRIRTSDWDWQGAESSLSRALELAPEDADTLIAFATLARIRGRADAALAFARRAVAVDPLSVDGHRVLGASLMAAGLEGEAEAVLRTAIDLSPAGGGLRSHVGAAQLRQGRPAEALATIREEPNEYARLMGTAMACHTLGQAAEADAAMRRLIEGYSDTCAYQIAGVYGHRGEIDLAFEWLERAYRQRDHGLHSLLVSHFLRTLHGDPRWPPLLAKMGLAD